MLVGTACPEVIKTEESAPLMPGPTTSTTTSTTESRICPIRADQLCWAVATITPVRDARSAVLSPIPPIPAGLVVRHLPVGCDACPDPARSANGCGSVAASAGQGAIEAIRGRRPHTRYRAPGLTPHQKHSILTPRRPVRPGKAARRLSYRPTGGLQDRGSPLRCQSTRGCCYLIMKQRHSHGSEL